MLTESNLKEDVLSQQDELFGRVINLVGDDDTIIKCTDGKYLVLVAPWLFQSDKADIIWRYTAANAEKSELEQEGYLKDLDLMGNKVIVAN